MAIVRNLPRALRSATKGHFRANVLEPPPKWATTCIAYPSIFHGDPTSLVHEMFSLPIKKAIGYESKRVVNSK